LLKEGRFAAAVSPLAAATVLNVPLDSLLNIEHGKEDSSVAALVYREGWIDELCSSMAKTRGRCASARSGGAERGRGGGDGGKVDVAL
jgi:hypothetical protein